MIQWSTLKHYYSQWRVPVLIILVGLTLRIFAVVNTKTPYVNNYDTIRKVTLNFSDQKKILSSSIDRWTDADSLRKQLFTTSKPNPDFKALNKELDASNHPPLYYYIYHPVKIWLDGGSHKLGSGYALNLILWLVGALIFYKLCVLVFQDENTALMALVFYATHLGSMTPIILLKAYVLQEVLVLLSVYLYFKYSKNEIGNWRQYVLYGLVIYLAFLSHYFSYIIIGVFSLVIGLLTIHSRSYKKLLAYAATTLLSVILAIITYPNTIRDLMDDKRSQEIQENVDSLSASSELSQAIETFTKYMVYWPHVVCIILAFSVLLSGKIKWSGKLLSTPILLFLLGMITYLTFEFLLVRSFVRYLAICVPFIIIGIAYFSQKFISQGKWTVFSFLIICFLYSGNLLYTGINSKGSSERIIQNWNTKGIPEAITKNKTSTLIIPAYTQHFTEAAVFIATKGKEVALSNNLDPEFLKNKKDVVIMIRKSHVRKMDKEIKRNVLSKQYDHLFFHNGYEIYKLKE